MKQFKEKIKFLYQNLLIQTETLMHNATQKGLLNNLDIMKHYYIFWGKQRMLEILLNEINIYLMKKVRKDEK